ncbi:MAG: hypothetical protein KJZ65_12370 [Phycisphaerales bacterium]|nr:hypothetical protein [Phycisphaerales bacterium]
MPEIVKFSLVSRPFAWFVLSTLSALASNAQAQGPSLPPPPFPSENPLTEPKRVLGKILFWEEQLSSDNTMACGTCHMPARGGTDPRVGINPGPDGLFGTPDDKRGSPGMIHQDESLLYDSTDFFGLAPQVGTRNANSAIMAMYAPELFWDGRASSQFIDPQTGAVIIPVGGALESQAVGPVMNVLEMAHEGRDWDQVAAKLATAHPLALATDLPPDMADAIASHPTYPSLFAAAFGDGEITAARIGMAIATYERTLVPNQTPWDFFVAGDPAAMTPQQINGWNAFNGSRCSACHTPPQFTNNTFRNIGLRPIPEDIGRQQVTGNPADRARFKVPSLRNVGLHNRFMHNGQFNTLGQVMGFYANAGGQQFPNNRDPLLNTPIAFPGPVTNDIINFLTNALTDPRVATEQFPFDRPTLHSERNPRNPLLIGAGTPGTGGFTPAMVAVMPPLIGSTDFKVGIDLGLAGATARLALSDSPPVAGRIQPQQLLGPVVLEGLLPGEGFATLHWPIPLDSALDGRVVYMQWMVDDPAAAGGQALSRVAQLTLTCGAAGCASACAPDLNADGVLDFFDVAHFLSAFSAGLPQADFNADGALDFFDAMAFLDAFSHGCP